MYPPQIAFYTFVVSFLSDCSQHLVRVTHTTNGAITHDVAGAGIHVVQDMSSEELIDDLCRVVNKDDVDLIVLDSLVKIQHRYIPKIAQIKGKSEMTFLLTNRSSIQVSRTSEQDRKSRSSSNSAFADMVDYRIMIEPRTENERRVVVMSSTSVDRREWIVSLGYGGFYQDNRSLKLHSRRVQRYLRRLRNHKLL